jgi:hypothetical protein
MREVMKKEVLKLLHAGIIYPIPHSDWVSPVHVVPKKGGMTVVENRKTSLLHNEPSRDGECVSITESSIRQQRKIAFHCPSLPKCWSGWQSTLSFVFSMGIRGIIRFPSTPTIKARPHSRAHMEHTHIVECRLGCVMHPLHSNGA